MVGPQLRLPPRLLNPEDQKLFETHPELTKSNGMFNYTRARNRYYEPELLEKIIASRKTGLSPRQAFLTNGCQKKTFDEWKEKLNDVDCPKPILYVFANICIEGKDDKYIPRNHVIPLYCRQDIVELIISYKKKGLSDRVAFLGAGVSEPTMCEWKRVLREKPDCDPRLKSLFREMAKVHSQVMADIVGIAVEEAIQNKNWKAAVELMPRLWRKEFGNKLVAEDPISTAPTYNIDKLTPDEQEVFIALHKRVTVVNNSQDGNNEKVKLIISLPDNGR